MALTGCQNSQADGEDRIGVAVVEGQMKVYSKRACEKLVIAWNVGILTNSAAGNSHPPIAGECISAMIHDEDRDEGEQGQAHGTQRPT